MKARTYPVVLSLAGVLLGSAASWSAEPAPLPHVFLDPQEPAFTEIRRLGENTIDRAGSALVLEVRRIMAQTPTIDAIRVMHLRDYQLPAPAPGSIMRVTKLKPTSLQVRNPVHAPDGADRAALDLIQGQLEAGDPVDRVLVQRVTLPGQPPEWRVYRPLSVMNECLQCHGTTASLPPGVAERLKELYPEDTAVNYRPSAWRGLLRVSITDQPVGK